MLTLNENARERRVDAGLDARLGTTFAGRYHIRRLLGAGGMGVVYEAHDRTLDRAVALKLLPPGLRGDVRALARLRTEARASARLDHPNLLRVFDVVEDDVDGSVCIVQEALGGKDLRRLLDERARLPLREALEALVPILDGLATAHAAGVFHRDVKPDNILVEARADESVHATLIDFGIARIDEDDARGLTTHRTMLGTPRYMSPEHVDRSVRIDGRADTWAAAVVLYETLSGRHPFEAPDRASVLRAIEAGRAPALHELAPELPRGLCAAIHRALLRDPARRTASVAALLSEVAFAPALARAPWMIALRARLRSAPGAPARRAPRLLTGAATLAWLAAIAAASFAARPVVARPPRTTAASTALALRPARAPSVAEPAAVPSPAPRPAVAAPPAAVQPAAAQPARRHFVTARAASRPATPALSERPPVAPLVAPRGPAPADDPLRRALDDTVPLE